MTRAKDISKILTDADLNGTLEITKGASGASANAAADELVLQNSGDAGLSILSPNANNSQILLGSPVANAGGIIRWTGDDNAVKIGTNNTGSTLRFHVGGFSEVMRISSAGFVGIATSNPLSILDIAVEASDTRRFLVNYDDNIITVKGSNQNSNPESLRIVADNFRVSTGTTGSGTERMRITSSGNVGINETAPLGTLHVRTSDASITSVNANSDDLIIENNGNCGISIASSTTGEGMVSFVDSGDTNIGRIQYQHSTNEMNFRVNDAERMRIKSDGRIGVNTSNADAEMHIEPKSSATNASILLSNNGRTQYFRIQNNETDDALIFNANDASERMRIDSSGNLLVGKTAISVAAVGVEARADGIFASTRSGGESIRANRTSSNGNIIQLRKDNATVGNIGSEGGDSLYIVSGDTGLRFSGGADIIIPASTAGASRDNAIDLGSSGARFDDIFATNGTIQTSDRNEKQDIEELTDAEKRVAVVAKGLMRKFRWKDKVAEKGDNARTHFGIIAQDLQDAFTAEGLDAGDYAMFISTTWTNDDGNEQTRLGVRYNQLLAFIISAI